MQAGIRRLRRNYAGCEPWGRNLARLPAVVGRKRVVTGALPYWRAMAMRIASSGETRWSEFSAASAMAS